MNVTPVALSSRNVAKTLLEFAQERGIDPRSLEFELLSYETLIQTSGDDEYKVMQQGKIIGQEELLNPSISFAQEYFIRVFSKEHSRAKSDIKLSLASNKLKTKAIVTIQKGSVFAEHNALFSEVRNLIWCKKIVNGFFIELFEPNLENKITKLISLIPHNKPLNKDIKFSVALGLEPQPPVDAKLVRLYDRKENREKSLIKGVANGELILRYIKPKEGMDGRGCNAKYIQVREPREIDKRPIVDDTIKEIEQSDSVEYYANCDGYIEVHNDNFTVLRRLKLDSANFRSSGTINTGADKDVAVYIGGGKYPSDDAVGSGVKIEVKTLDIQGNIGPNVTISTQNLNIAAQTHKSSILEADVANIALHRGTLRARLANIDILETGKVYANQSIRINKMLGGEAIAPTVIVDAVLANSIIIASELIEVNSTRGANIKLIIDPVSIEGYDQRVNALIEESRSLSSKLRINKEHFDIAQEEHLDGAKRIRQCQLNILKAQQTGTEAMAQDIARVKQYNKVTEDLKVLENELKTERLHVEKLDIELDRLYRQDIHAKIINRGEYDGYTQVIFIDPKTKVKISLYPEGKQEIISLVIGKYGKEIRFD